MDLTIKSLRDSRRMAIPDVPSVIEYGSKWGAALHDIQLFPAAIRSTKVVKPETVLEEGQSTCFFHPKVSATAICDLSGRMICDLCATEYEGKTVSVDALQTVVNRKGSSKDGHTRWDTIALALAVLPLIIFGFFTLVTAPVALGICIFKWKEGPLGVPPRMRWRYLVAGLLSLVQMAFWVLLFTGMLAEVL